MVNFKAAFQSLKQIGFTGPIHAFHEYRVDVTGQDAQVNMLGSPIGKGLQMPRETYIGYLRRDREFFSKLMADAQLL
jgi:hypothetical protein